MNARILHLVGARPNFVKMAPLVAELRTRAGLENLVAHTGQHYDRKMSDEILGDLELPEPDFHLGVGSGSHGAQTARALSACEELIQDTEPDLLVVAGDVNSTLAGALAAAKLGVQVAHLEAGLRSGDWGMPEEINRILTDRLSDVLLTHSPEAEPNLLGEGIDPSRIHLVGNTMIDSLRRFERVAAERALWERFDLEPAGYVLVTLHRPSNVDDPERLERIVDGLIELASRSAVVFPVHPRTRGSFDAAGLSERLLEAGVQLLEPVGYLDFLSLELAAGAALTDSGGIQEETSALGVPCFTLRANTERPLTIEAGTNVLLGDDPAQMARVELDRRWPREARELPLWDGAAARRAADVLVAHLDSRSSKESSYVRDTAVVLDCRIDRLTLEQTVSQCEQAVITREPIQHMAVNAAKLVAMRVDDDLRAVVGDSELVTADGQAVVWASRLLGDPLPERVTGVDLMHRLFELSAERGFKVFILGAKQEVLEEAVSRLKHDHPTLQLAGYRNGYFGREQWGEVAREIRDAQPDLLFVAITSPTKELFLGEYRELMNVPFVMGVGGAIDIVAGITRRAPVLWQRLGLEWLYRLLQEPRRMAKRYAVTNTKFVTSIARAWLRRLTGGRTR